MKLMPQRHPEDRIYTLTPPVNDRIAVPEGPGLGLDPGPNVIRGYLRVGADTGVQKAA